MPTQNHTSRICRLVWDIKCWLLKRCHGSAHRKSHGWRIWCAIWQRNYRCESLKEPYFHFVYELHCTDLLLKDTSFSRSFSSSPLLQSHSPPQESADATISSAVNHLENLHFKDGPAKKKGTNRLYHQSKLGYIIKYTTVWLLLTWCMQIFTATSCSPRNWQGPMGIKGLCWLPFILV